LRTCWIVLLAVLASAAASRQAAEPARLRVLTYNIHHGEGTDGRIDLARTAAVIARAAADVVALQEVDNQTTRAHGVDQAAELGRLTGMHAAFGQAMAYAGGGYGDAILSRFPLSAVRVHDLPTAPGAEPRCAIAARIQAGGEGRAFVFVSTHLEHAQAPIRLLQAQALTSALAPLGDVTTILSGDFNDVPGGPAIAALRPHWADASAGQPDPTSPSSHPRRKIDYVFFRPSGAWRVVESRVIDEPVASDHRPLLVVLEAAPPPASEHACGTGASREPSRS